MSRAFRIGLRLAPVLAYGVLYAAQASGALSPSAAIHVTLVAFYIASDLLVGFIREGKVVDVIRLLDAEGGDS